jgi:hypothetical protein
VLLAAVCRVSGEGEGKQLQTTAGTRALQAKDNTIDSRHRVHGAAVGDAVAAPTSAAAPAAAAAKLDMQESNASQCFTVLL